MISKKLTFITFLLLPNISAALFCPTNFKQIYVGDSMDTVQQQCGKPDAETTKKEAKNTPQEWSYFIPQTVSMNMDNTSQAQGTLKTTIAFDANGKIINISVNGIGVGATQICGTSLQLGDTKDRVKAVCGDPSYTNKQQNDSNGGKKEEDTITEFNYHTTPPVTLIFVNGSLTERR
jgi:hypothetical protein